MAFEILPDKKTIADRVVDLRKDSDGKGSWLGIGIEWLVIGVLVLYVGNFIQDRFFTRQANKEISEAVQRANSERLVFEEKLKLADKNAQALAKEVEWARDQKAKDELIKTQLRAKNAELNELLQKEYPSSLLGG